MRSQRSFARLLSVENPLVTSLARHIGPIGQIVDRVRKAGDALVQKPRLTATATPIKTGKGPIRPVQKLHQASAFLNAIQKFHTDKTFLQRLCIRTLYTTIIIFAMGQCLIL